MMTHIFGSTALAGFMAGMTLGSWLAGRIADRTANCRRLYAWLEIDDENRRKFELKRGASIRGRIKQMLGQLIRHPLSSQWLNRAFRALQSWSLASQAAGSVWVEDFNLQNCV